MRWLGIALLLSVGCGPDVGPGGRDVGGDCSSNRDCNGFCVVDSSHYPGGMCTFVCRSDRDCPDGTMCIDDKGGICGVACRFPGDCYAFGPGWTCDDKSRLGAPGDALICRVP